MIGIDALINAPLPLSITYDGKHPVKRTLRHLTIVGWKDLSIGFLSENGSKAAVMADGQMMWILDVALNYSAQGSDAPQRQQPNPQP